MSIAEQKAQFYEQLAVMLQSGLSVERIASLPQLSRSALAGKWCAALRRGLAAGSGIATALHAEGTTGISEMEWRLLEAAERGGKLEDGCRRLAVYFSSLAEIVRAVRSRLLYPAFVVHLAILVSSIPVLAQGGSVVTALFLPLLCLWAGIALLVWAGRMLWARAATSVACDRFLLRLPLVGPFRRNALLARFNHVFGISLQAGILVSESASIAAGASGSPSFQAALAPVVDSVRRGSQLAPHLPGISLVPEEMTTSIATGETVGRLDEMAVRLAERFQSDTAESARTLCQFIPRLILGMVGAYVAWTVYRMWAGYFSLLENVMKDGL